ncbi:hypothetical protein ED733_003646 [Metarhizium rileyi]|uniref:Chromo domain-containing protein n=1 Tax=Metarhizium rileyi (strain RCEF 4871) TaxID=1649241 RepID=A0A5C6G2E6_METRR|nr:hypothetical protein ED733_003646 [Metarhizium rileyi]
MNAILATLFSPRKASEHREAASPPTGRKSALSNRKSRTRSLPEQKKMDRSVRFQHILNDTDVSPIPVKSPASPTTKRPPEKTTGSEASPARKSPRRGNRLDRDAEDVEYTFNRFTDYRWNGDSIEIQVEWEAGDRTWEDEDQLHQDAPDALLAYWENQGGRPLNPSNPDLFIIHAIQNHSKDRKRLLVEWVGYGPKEATWVPRKVVEETAPEVVAQYWKTVKPTRRKQRQRRKA